MNFLILMSRAIIMREINIEKGKKWEMVILTLTTLVQTTSLKMVHFQIIPMTKMKVIMVENSREFLINRHNQLQQQIMIRGVCNLNLVSKVGTFLWPQEFKRTSIIYYCRMISTLMVTHYGSILEFPIRLKTNQQNLTY